MEGLTPDNLDGWDRFGLMRSVPVSTSSATDILAMKLMRTDDMDLTRFTEQTTLQLTAFGASKVLIVVVEPNPWLKLSSSIHARTQAMPRIFPLLLTWAVS